MQIAWHILIHSWDSARERRERGILGDGHYGHCPRPRDFMFDFHKENFLNCWILFMMMLMMFGMQKRIIELPDHIHDHEMSEHKILQVLGVW